MQENNIFKSFDAAMKVPDNVHILDMHGQKNVVLKAGVEKMVNLRILNLGDNQIKQLPASLLSLPNLENLDVSDTSLRDISVLIELKSIKKINCLNTHLTKQQIIIMRSKLPNCEIIENAKKVRPMFWREKLWVIFMISAVVVISYYIMRTITPTTNEADGFFAWYLGLNVAVIVIAIIVKFFVGVLKKNISHTE